MTLVFATVATVLGEDMSLVLQVQQSPIVMVATQENAATLTTVTTIRTAVGIVFHMFQVHRAPATLSRAAHDLHVVNEITFHTFLFTVYSLRFTGD